MQISETLSVGICSGTVRIDCVPSPGFAIGLRARLKDGWIHPGVTAQKWV